MRFLKSLALALAVLFGALLTGCTEDEEDGEGHYSMINLERTSNNTVGASSPSSVRYLCVGMEYSSRFGSCPGCKRDSSRMHELFSGKFGYSGKLLQSEQATRDAVVSAISEGIASTPSEGLFIFYYSGHGGQEYLGNFEPEGSDAEDEYLCLYDTYLLDDEIWKLISSREGRIFLCFDACHSQTMFRSIRSEVLVSRGNAVPLEVRLVPSHGFRMRPVALPMGLESGFSMICWSGCLESEYSYGSILGGIMTNAILGNWKEGVTYDELWSRVSSDVNSQQPVQHPYSTSSGTSFGSREAFR